MVRQNTTQSKQSTRSEASAMKKPKMSRKAELKSMLQSLQRERNESRAQKKQKYEEGRQQ